MMDDLDAAVGGVLAGNTPQKQRKPADPLDAAVGSVLQDEQATLRGKLRAAVTVNPDQAAEADKLAKRYPIPQDVLARNLLDVKLQAAVDEADKRLQTSPKLAQALREKPWLAQQSHDDVGPLSGLEQTLAKRPERTVLGTAGDVGVTALKGAVGLPQAFVGLLDLPTFGYAGKGLEAIGLRFEDAQKMLDTMFSPAQQASNAAVKEAQGFFDTLGAMLQNPSTIATTVGESAPQMLGGAAIGKTLISMAPKMAPWLAAALGEGVMGAGSAAEQIRTQTDDGLLSAKQVLASIGSGAGTALFGAVGGRTAARLGLGDIDTALVAKGVDQASAKALQQGFIASVVKAGISEGVFEELPQSVQEQLWQNWATDRPLGEGVGKAAAQGLLAGLTMGGGFQALGETAARIEARMTGTAGQVQDAEQNMQQLQNALQLAAQSKLRERNPDTFKELVQQMADQTEGAPTSVFIDAQTLAQSGINVAEVFPRVVEQLDAALATNGAVEVPISEVLAAVPGTPLEEFFLQNARSTPDGLSMAEAQEASKQLDTLIKTEAERITQQAADQQAWASSAETVKTTLLGQLNTAGRFSNDVNEAYATLVRDFYAVTASRLGMTPDQLYARYPLRVAGAQEAGAALDQATSLAGLRDAAVKARSAYADFETAVRGGQEPDADTYFKLSDAVNNAEQALTAALEAVPDDTFAVQATTPDGRMLMLNPSAQKPGHYQLTRFGTDGAPWGDTQYPTKAQALRDFMDEADIATVKDFSGHLNQAPAAFDGPETGSTPIGDATTVEVDGKTRPALNSNGQPIHPTLEGVRNFWRWFGDSKVVDDQGRPLVVYHGSGNDFAEFNTQGGTGKTSGTGSFFTTSAPVANSYASGESRNVMPVYLNLSAPVVIDAKGKNWNRIQQSAKVQLPAVEVATKTDQSDEDLLAELEGRTPEKVKPTKRKAKNTNVRQLFAGEWDYPDDTATTDDIARWVRANGYEGVVVNNVVDRGPSGAFDADAALTPSVIFVAFNPTQIKSATGNSGAFDGRDANILRQSSQRFSEDNRLSNLNPNGASWARIRENNPALKGKGPDDLVTVYRATIGDTIRPDDFVAVDKSTLRTELKNVRARDGKAAKIIEQQVRVRDLLMGNDATEFVYYPEEALNQQEVDELTGLPLNPDGTVTVYHHTSAANAQAIARTGRLKSAGEPDVYVTTRKETDTGYGDTAVPIRVNPELLLLDDEFPDGRMDFRIETGRPGGSVAVKVGEYPTLNQQARGTFNPSKLLITLNPTADLSTFLHESGHFFLDMLADMASQPNAPAEITDDMNRVLAWFGIKGDEQVGGVDSGAPLAQLLPDFAAMQAKVDQQRELTAKRPEGSPLRAVGERALQRLESELQAERAKHADTLAKLAGTKITDSRGNPLVVYHGGGTAIAESGKFKRKEGGRAVWFSDTQVAGTYAGTNEGSTLYPVYLDAKNPLEFDAAGATWQELEFEGQRLSTDDLAEIAEQRGHDALIIRNLRDANTDDGGQDAADHFAVFKPEQIVSALSGGVLAQGGNLPTDSTQPAGRTPLEVWNAMTLDQKREHHERWAEAFEQYLFEGKAPNQELQPLFRRFRAWLTNVYKSMTAFLRGRNLQLSDEVRGVFDRLLATDEQIAQAEQAAGLLPDMDATAEAIEKLQARSLRDLKWAINARSRKIRELQKQAAGLRKEVEAEVRAEVDAMPEFQAQAALDKLRKDNKRAPNDLEMATVAEANGYATTEAMLQAIDAIGKKRDVVDGMTSQRMLERYGDLSTPEAIEQAATEAVHNEARAKSLATELKAQADMLGEREDTGRTASNGRPITVNTIKRAAQDFARNLAARTVLRDLKGRAAQHRAAEAKAGKRWQEATAKGKTQDAVQAKRDQVLNNAAVKALTEAQTEARQILEFFRRVTKGNDEKVVERGRDPDVVNAARAILAAYGVAPRLQKGALEYMEAVKTNDPAMYAALEPGLRAAMDMAQPLDALSMEQLRGLHDEIRSMWDLAKRSRQMEVDGNLLDLDDAADELKARMVEVGIPDTIPGETRAVTQAEERKMSLSFLRAALSRVEQWAERIDGAFGGPFLRLVFQPIKRAADRYRTQRADYRKRFTALVEGLNGKLPPGPIAAPELGYTFGGSRDSGVAELLHAILHTGNDSNKRKLLLGRNWATENPDGTLDTSRWDAFVQRMVTEGKLQREHFDFAQGVWDLLEELKPGAQQAHRTVFGRYFSEVTANEFTDPFGVPRRGGYVPAMADTRLTPDQDIRKAQEEENDSMAMAFPSSPSGFTKARVEYNRPLLLDLRTLAQHMDKVILFTHMQPAVTDVRRLIARKDVAYGLSRIDPAIYKGMLIPWLNRAARQTVETPISGDGKVSRFASALRARAGMALMFANVSNTLQQITGFTSAGVKVRPSLMLEAAAKYMAAPRDTAANVAALSEYMRDRMNNETSAMSDVVDEMLVNPSVYDKAQAWTQRHGYFLQTLFDNTMSPIIWTAAYNQATEQKMTADQAVQFADGVIRQTQGTTLPEDVSRFETGPAYARLFTQFIGYFNMMANTNATAFKQAVDGVGLRKGAGRVLYIALMGVLLPIWIAEAIAQAFRGGPDDEDKDGEYLDDWLMAVFGLGTARGLLAQVPLVGVAAQGVINRFNDNPADDKFSLSPAVSLVESAVASPASVYKAIADDGDIRKAVRDVAAAATLATGLPIYAAARPAGYLAGVAQDKIEPTSPADMARGIITGTASPESKQR